MGVAPEPGQPAVLREKDVLPHQAQPRRGQQQRYEVDGGVDGAVTLRTGDEYTEGHAHRRLGQPAERGQLKCHQQGVIGDRVREELAPVGQPGPFYRAVDVPVGEAQEEGKDRRDDDECAVQSHSRRDADQVGK